MSMIDKLEQAEHIVNYNDGFPDFVTVTAETVADPPELAPELIKGVLRQGHKMLISGSSKAGKSFLLAELCIAIADGGEWLGFKCRKGRVLYINLEIDSASCVNRFATIYKAMNREPKTDNLVIWNLRGMAAPLSDLKEAIVNRTKGLDFAAIVIDPIYKIMTGDENSASDMGAFCNCFDYIANETGASLIYCHHHSKGYQGGKKAQDRASGSGVFSRDPDAQLDIIELDVPELIDPSNMTAWRLEGVLREFKSFAPRNFWFDYPVHRVDTAGDLKEAFAEGSAASNLAKSSKRTSELYRRQRLDEAFQKCAENGTASASDMAEWLNISQKSINRYVHEFSLNYTIKNGNVTKK